MADRFSFVSWSGKAKEEVFTNFFLMSGASGGKGEPNNAKTIRKTTENSLQGSHPHGPWNSVF